VIASFTNHQYAEGLGSRLSCGFTLPQAKKQYHDVCIVFHDFVILYKLFHGLVDLVLKCEVELTLIFIEVAGYDG
jgi:hypothetical protein